MLTPGMSLDRLVILTPLLGLPILFGMQELAAFVLGLVSSACLSLIPQSQQPGDQEHAQEDDD
jgi:hypothetical protein